MEPYSAEPCTWRWVEPPKANGHTPEEKKNRKKKKVNATDTVVSMAIHELTSKHTSRVWLQ